MKKPKGAQESPNSDAKSKQAQKNPKVKHPKVERRRDKQEIAIIATSRWENTNSGLGVFTFFWCIFFVPGKNASCFWTGFVALRLLCEFRLFGGEEVFSGLVLGRASEDETLKWPRPTRNPKVKQVRAWKARRWNPKVAKANPKPEGETGEG